MAEMIGKTARPEAQESGRQRPWARWAARLGGALVALQLTQGRKDRGNSDLAEENDNLGEV